MWTQLGYQQETNFNAATIGLRTSGGTITEATNASPIVVTSAGHGRATGDVVTIDDVLGNTAANGVWQIAVIDANTFSLNRSTGNGAYTSGGEWRRIPPGTQFVLLRAEGADVRYRDDGTEPTASVGQILKASDVKPLLYQGPLEKVKFIGTAAGSILNIDFYKVA